MATKLAQGTRIGRFQSPLGEDKLVLSRFDGSEGLSEMFEYTIELLSEDHLIDFDDALGKNCCVSIKSGHKDVLRHFNGVLVDARWVGKQNDLSSYRVILRPWLWMLTRTTNCRIFNEKTVPEIIQEVFSQNAFAKFELNLTASYQPLEYCVQYRESDQAFVSRLMEEFGIYYFFDHSSDEHKLVLADSASAHKPKPGGASLSFYATDLHSIREEDSLNEFSVGRRFRSGKVTLNDYDYKKPTADLVAEQQGSARYANAELELYDYPGRYIERSVGSSLATIRLEAEQAQDKRTHAAGDAVTCTPGSLIQLVKHPEKPLNKEYLVIRASHTYRSNAYLSSSGGAEETYFGQYEFQQSDVPFRAPTVTAKPMIYGPQTAVVASEVDEQCRIKVHFHWDRKKTDSRYVRIAQRWSGAQWGDIRIPRIGMEVIVEFLEGDPDQPLITGTVYNADNETPYPLPADKSITGVKSKSFGSGYNEFILDDRDGDELVRLHAERDLLTEVKNDETRKVGKHKKEDIGRTWIVEANEKIEFKVGTSTFTMTPKEITLKASFIKAEADVLLSLKSTGVGEIKTAAPLTVNGAVVRIN
jgi:type VI secretion system secreted protein VgrG